MKKTALSPAMRKALHGLGIGGAMAAGGYGGHLLGEHVTPQMFGYENDPQAVNMSKNMDMILYGLLAGMGAKSALKPGTGLSRFISKHPVTFATSLSGAELAPIGAHAINKLTDAAKDVSTSAEKFKPTPGITQQVGSLLKTPEARGAGVGTAAAGLGAIITGMMKRKQQGESRLGVVGKDFATYALPGAALGGLIAHLMKDAKQNGLPD